MGAGSLTANAAAAGRGRAGIVVALAAVLLLGAGYGYLQWISTQAPAFAGDPARYGITDTPDIPGAWQFLDLSVRWTANINSVRANDGLPPLRTDGPLTHGEGQDLRQQ